MVTLDGATMFLATAVVLLATTHTTAAAAATKHTTIATGWANSSDGVHTFLTFASGALVRGLEANPSDPRAQRLDFVWGASESAVPALRVSEPHMATSVARFRPRD